MNWHGNVTLGVLGRPRDPVLTAYGLDQAAELATHFLSLPSESRPQLILSSPYYHTVQTALPTSKALALPIHLETGSQSGISIYAASEQDEGFFDGKGDTPPPPLKKRRRSSASSLSSYSGSSSFGSSAHNSSAPVGNSKTSEQPTAAAGLGTLLATLDSAPVTIRGRSRKHFAGAAAASC
ncbi:hypothetical protein CF336_g7109 [Tilletia laevis]|nr:hypothetical protein CF336_g7109 [Tilletia laevis]